MSEQVMAAFAIPAVLMVFVALGLICIVVTIDGLESRYGGLPPGMARERLIVGSVAIALMIGAVALGIVGSQFAQAAAQSPNSPSQSTGGAA